MRFIYSAFFLFIVLCAEVSAGQTQPAPLQDNREEAERLWEEAIAAKGGRERLYSITNLQLSIRDKAWWNLRRVPNDMEALFVFPNKSWILNDQTGTLFQFSILMHNYEEDIHWAYSDNGKEGQVSSVRDVENFRSAREIIINAQLNYLMETRWVKPIPVSVDRGKVGRHAVDIVRTVVRDYPKREERVSFALDRETHLPRQVIFHTVVFGEEYTGAVSYSDYVAINGIQMPGKVGNKRWSFQLNVDYNERIFEQPPSRAAGIEAWKNKH